MDQIEEGGTVTAPPVTPSPPSRGSLAEVKRQEDFEVNEGVWISVHMVGDVYLGDLLVTYVANKELLKEQKRLGDMWRKKNSKPKDAELPDDVAEDHIRTSWVGRVLHDFRNIEEEPGKPLAHPDMSQPGAKAELHQILRDLLEIRTFRAAVLQSIIKEETFALRELESTRGNS